MSYTTLSHMNCTVLNSTIEYSLNYFYDLIIREGWGWGGGRFNFNVLHHTVPHELHSTEQYNRIQLELLL